MTGASFNLAKAEFDKVRAAKRGQPNLLNKPSLGVPSVPGVAGTGPSGEGTAGVGQIAQHHFTRTVGQTHINLVPLQGVSPLYTQAPVSQSHPSPIPSNRQPLVDSPILHVPSLSVQQSQWPKALQQPQLVTTTAP